MIHAHMNEERAAPLWAALGVPALGIPLMVALLALTAPGEPAPAPDGGEVVETLEVQAIDRSLHCMDPPLQSG